MLAGIVTVLLFTPLGNLLGGDFTSFTAKAKANLDVSFIGFTVNAIVFAVVSKFTRPLDQTYLQSLAADMDTDQAS